MKGFAGRVADYFSLWRCTTFEKIVKREKYLTGYARRWGLAGEIDWRWGRYSLRNGGDSGVYLGATMFDAKKSLRQMAKTKEVSSGLQVQKEQRGVFML